MTPKADAFDHARLSQDREHAGARERRFPGAGCAEHEKEMTRVVLVGLRFTQRLDRAADRSRASEKNRRMLEVEWFETTKRRTVGPRRFRTRRERSRRDCRPALRDLAQL